MGERDDDWKREGIGEMDGKNRNGKQIETKGKKKGNNRTKGMEEGRGIEMEGEERGEGQD